MPPRIPFVIGIMAWCLMDLANARASTRVRLPMPTSETIPYVAEVMGATSYEESIEEDGGEVKRVQRKLTGPEHKEPDLDQEDQYAEYQGVIGRPGVDFPVLPSIPRTDFSCRKVKSSGYYADLETGCQVFHICDGGRKISFLCPNGTIFRQSHLICDWWFRVDCERSVELYEESAEQLAHDQMIYKKRAEEIAKAMTAKVVITTEAARPTSSISYDQRQQRRKPRPQPEPESIEQERQIPAETASFASNRHRFGNQIENQYRQFYATTSTSTSPPFNKAQGSIDYNTEQYQEPLKYNNYNTNGQSSYDNSYSITSDSGKVKNKSNYQAVDSSNYPSKSNNYPSTANNNYQGANNNNYPTDRNYPSGNYQISANSNHPNVNNYQTSTNNPRNNPSAINNYPTTSSYKYQNKDYLSSNNNYPNRNYNNNAQTNNKNQTYTVSNYSISTVVNKNSQGNSNSNYPSRGNTNYFTSTNNNNPNNNKYSSSPSSTSTNKSPVDSPFSTYNYSSSSSERGSTYTSKSEKYSEYSKSESRIESGRIQPNQNDYVPIASTTVRSVTNKIASYNDHTPRYEKYTSTGLKQKPIFNVKIKPTKDTKDFTYVELLRHEEKMNSQRVTSESPIYSSSASPNPSSEEVNPQTVPVSQLITTLPPVETPTSSRNTYLPKETTTESQKNNVNINPVINRYASINVSGTAEEIRPEIVNALMESGVTPTSAKALHSLASYISSGAAEEDYSNIYSDTNHPHVSDVILNFHSGSPVTAAYSSSEGTTHSPPTSSGEDLPSVLTKATKESYSYLFSDSKEQTDLGKEEIMKIKPESVSSTQKPQTTSQPNQDAKGTTNKQEPKGDLKLKDSTELRELAQVFSRALSAYLEDPETFKEILAQVRPTEPNVDNTTPSVEDEVLDFSDAMLGRLGTTIGPITTIGNSDYIDDNVNIGEINSLASGSKTYEPDNSLEQNTFPPTAPEADNRYTSASPKLLLFKPNSLSNNSQQSDYYKKLGSAEDESYFPTLGGVSDTSRPRYGGFQNNTGKTLKPYGADVPKNITGAPISSPSPTSTPDLAVYTKSYNSSTTTQNIPEPHDVNSLIKSNVLNADHSSGEESFEPHQTSPSFVEEDTFYPSGENEKGLITSGSQSLVSSNNYVQFAKKFNEQQVQLKGKEYQEQLRKANSVPSAKGRTPSKQEDLSSYFGQEPPVENLARPSGFKSPSVTIVNKEASTKKKTVNKQVYTDSDPINYHIGIINEELATPAPLFGGSHDYDVSYSDYITGSGVSSDEYRSSTSSVSYDQPAWTVSPLFDVTSAGTSVQFNYTQKPMPQRVSPKFHPTTYHPPHSSEPSEVVDSQWETTFQTENSPSGETTPAYDLDGAGTTLSFDDQYKNFEKAAKDMFGMLNETAAAKLMDMMVKGESNMTIRRLVLLLVNDKARESLSTQESRDNLINALLTNIEDSPATLPTKNVTTTTTTTTTTTQSPRKKVRVSRVRVSTTPLPKRTEQQRSGKSYRGTESMTAVHGSAPSPSDINKINAAKLYIPSPSSEPLTSKLPLDSDARAVELLKTLYSLAAKWG